MVLISVLSKLFILLLRTHDETQTLQIRLNTHVTISDDVLGTEERGTKTCSHFQLGRSEIKQELTISSSRIRLSWLLQMKNGRYSLWHSGISRTITLQEP